MKTRQSNIELLRLIAMFLVLLVHANYASLGGLSNIDIQKAPTFSFLRIFIEQASLICVNLFIIISGWFGIRFSWKGIGSILFQCSFYCILITVLFFTLDQPISRKILFKELYIGDAYWFVPSYIVLFILSPFINVAIKEMKEKELRIMIFLLLALELFYGWINDVCGYANGYSPLSFLTLYIIGRYLKIYKIRFLEISSYKSFFIYLMIVFTSSILLFFGTLIVSSIQLSLQSKLCAYNSPFVILSSLYFFNIFRQISFNNKIINNMATSSFAIYLIHANPLTFPHFKKLIANVFINYNSYNAFIITIILLLIISIFSILIDKIRLFSWNLIVKHSK